MEQQSGKWLSDFPPKRWHLALAVACVAGVYLVGVTNRWWPTPDSALYLGLARSLANGEGYRFNGIINTLAAPGLPLILSVLRAAFGPAPWAPNLLSSLCGLSAIGFVYLTVARLSDRRIALAVALVTAFSYTFYLTSHRILTDVPFAAIFWILLYVTLRFRQSGRLWWLPLAGALAVAGVVMRPPGLLVLGPLALGVILDRPRGVAVGKRFAFACVVFVAAAVTALVLYLLARAASTAPPPYAGNVARLVNVGGLSHLLNFAWGMSRLPAVLSQLFTSQKALLPVGVAVLLLSIAGGRVLWRRGRRIIVTAVILYPIGLTIAGGGGTISPRYLLLVLPMVAYLSLEGLFWCVRRRYQRRARQPSP
ncbi:MAG: glycosyltransferase family 39 protein, partial [Planctomycetia bacterium]|nr:glycosyltransferase family 39 protein [Planctomycetia bacterium]